MKKHRKICAMCGLMVLMLVMSGCGLLNQKKVFDEFGVMRHDPLIMPPKGTALPKPTHDHKEKDLKDFENDMIKLIDDL